MKILLNSFFGVGLYLALTGVSHGPPSGGWFETDSIELSIPSFTIKLGFYNCIVSGYNGPRTHRCNGGYSERPSSDVHVFFEQEVFAMSEADAIVSVLNNLPSIPYYNSDDRVWCGGDGHSGPKGAGNIIKSIKCSLPSSGINEDSRGGEKPSPSNSSSPQTPAATGR